MGKPISASSAFSSIGLGFLGGAALVAVAFLIEEIIIKTAGK